MALTFREFSMLQPLVQRIIGSRYALTPSPGLRRQLQAQLSGLEAARPRRVQQTAVVAGLGELSPLGLSAGVEPVRVTGTGQPPDARNRGAIVAASAPVPVHPVRLGPHSMGRPRMMHPRRLHPMIVWHEITPQGKHVIKFVDRPNPATTPELAGLSLSKALKWAGNNLGTVLGAAALVGGAYWAQDQAGGWSQLLTADGWSRVGDAITGNSSVGAITVDSGAFDNLPGGTYLDPAMTDLAVNGPNNWADLASDGATAATDAATGIDWSNVFTGDTTSAWDKIGDASLNTDPHFVGPPSYLAATGSSGGSWLDTTLNSLGKVANIAAAFTGSGEAAPPNMYNRAMAATAGAGNPGQMAAQRTAPKKLLGVDPRTGQYVYSDGTRTQAPIPQAPAGAGMVSGPSKLPSWALPVGLVLGVVVLGMVAGGGGGKK
jgi:hypothetical protein